MQADTLSEEEESTERLRRLRAAALSVHLHVGPTRSMVPLLGAKMQPLGLREAVDELAKGNGPTARRLRKRAAAALERARDSSSSREFVATCDSAHKMLSVPEQAPSASGRIARSLLSVAAPAGAMTIPGCQVRNENVQADFDPHTFITSIHVTAQVNRPPSDMFSSSDPQNWSKLAPDSFRASNRIATNGAGFPIAAGFRDYVPLEGSPIGEPWKGFLLEEVEFSWDGFDLTTFRNLLNITFTPTPRKIDMQFELYRAIDCLVGVRMLDGGLEVDSGYFIAEADPKDEGWTNVDALKRLRFRDLTPDDSRFMEPGGSGQVLNFMSPAIVGLFMDQFVSEGTCMCPGS